MKTITIEGEINPQMLDNIGKQFEEQHISEGDDVEVLFDTEGGYVDVAFAIADLFTDMQSSGITMHAIARDKVWSSGIVPFLACNNRSVCKNSSFIVHPVKKFIPNEMMLGETDLQEMSNEINSYAELLNEYYEDKGIPDNIRKHLFEGEDYLINKPDELLKSGFAHTVTDACVNYINRFVRYFQTKKEPQFAFINKVETTINLNDMLKDQIKNQVISAVNEYLPDIVAKVMNDVSVPENVPVPTTVDEGEPLKEDELSKLTGVMYKTPVKVEGKPDIKYLVHPGKDVEKDHFVIPVKEDGEIEKLDAGDYKVEIDGEDFVVHSTGIDWYLHGKGVENKVDDEDKEKMEPVKNEAKDDEIKPEPDKSKAPSVNKIPVPNVMSKAEKYCKIFSQFGSGCVGK